MEKHNALLYSIVTSKCPRCRKGNIFPVGTLFTTKFANMHKECPCCGQDLEQEPGYYFGAMYISFAFNVAIFIIAFFILNRIVEEVTTLMMVGVVAVTVIGLLPVIFRLSRVLWIYIFVRYDATACSSVKK